MMTSFVEVPVSSPTKGKKHGRSRTAGLRCAVNKSARESNKNRKLINQISIIIILMRQRNICSEDNFLLAVCVKCTGRRKGKLFLQEFSNNAIVLPQGIYTMQVLLIL